MNVKYLYKNLLPLAACAAIGFAFAPQAVAQSAKADGTWTWTMQGRQGGQERDDRTLARNQTELIQWD